MNQAEPCEKAPDVQATKLVPCGAEISSPHQTIQFATT